MFVPSSDRCIVCHMYNWCVQVRCTCVCVCVCVCVVVYKKKTPYDSVLGHVRNNASVCTSVSQHECAVVKIYCGLGEWNTGCMQKWCNRATLTLHSCISVTDRVKINELNTSIAAGSLYVHTVLNLKRFECSYLKMWRF